MADRADPVAPRWSEIDLPDAWTDGAQRDWRGAWRLLRQVFRGVHTRIELPEGLEAQIRPRSGLARRTVNGGCGSWFPRGKSMRASNGAAPSIRPSSGTPSSSMSPAAVTVPAAVATVNQAGSSSGPSLKFTSSPKIRPPSNSLEIVSRVINNSPMRPVIGGLNPSTTSVPLLLRSRPLIVVSRA